MVEVCRKKMVGVGPAAAHKSNLLGILGSPCQNTEGRWGGGRRWSRRGHRVGRTLGVECRCPLFLVGEIGGTGWWQIAVVEEMMTMMMWLGKCFSGTNSPRRLESQWLV